MRRITTTHADRVSLSNAQYDLIYEVERVEQELRYILEDSFSPSPERGIEAHDVSHLERVLAMCADTLTNFLMEWRVCVGETDYPGEEYMTETAELLLERRKVTVLVDQLNAKIREAKEPTVKAALSTLRDHAAAQPDAQAITILEEVLKP